MNTSEKNMRLLIKDKNTELASDVIVADSFVARSKGLLGRDSLEDKKTLWIHRCNSIHTWFMKFSIDVVFVDKNLIVRSVHQNVAPWRLILPVWRARSVFEFNGGALEGIQITQGDQLYVGD